MFRVAQDLWPIIPMVFFVSGCVFYPRTIEYYDAECEIRYRQLVLKTEPMQIACSGANPSDPQGHACLAAILAISAGSGVVSGSIVVVGNTVYWLERRGKCLAKQVS